MYENFNLYENESQKLRIENTIADLEKNNIMWLSLDIKSLKKYFLEQDISIVQLIQINLLMKTSREVISKLYETMKQDHNKDSNSQQSEIIEEKIHFNKIETKDIEVRKTPSFQLEWEEITPYKILRIEEKEYTKEELLEIVSKRINFIQKYGTDKEEMKKEIDEILDAYNELTKESMKQR